MHNSREGVAVYYRFKPRDIELLCNDEENGVHIEIPGIHDSVFKRIKGRAMPYAPTGIPEKYDVAATNIKPSNYETSLEASERRKTLVPALNTIFRRRGLHILFLALTLTFVSSRFFLDWEKGGACAGAGCLVDPAMVWLQQKFPDMVSGWFEAMRQNPLWFTGFVLGFAFLKCRSGKLKALTIECSSNAWSALLGKGPREIPRSTDSQNCGYCGRINWAEACAGHSRQSYFY